jgi:diguanylate cyclase (GGDEF)-like protein
MPVVVISGSDDQEERDRAKAAGATDLITKGIGTAQLLSRLDILSKLVNTQREFERSLEELVRTRPGAPVAQLCSPYALQTQANALLTDAVQNKRNFILLNVCVSFKQSEPKDEAMPHSANVINAIGQLLQATVRQTDIVAKTGDAEFTLVTVSVNVDSARNFAERLCHAIASARLIKDDRIYIMASCGVASLAEHAANPSSPAPTLNALWELAHRRSLLGLHRGISGVVGAEQETAMWQPGRY